jgi:hypothetical protein
MVSVFFSVVAAILSSPPSEQRYATRSNYGPLVTITSNCKKLSLSAATLLYTLRRECIPGLFDFGKRYSKTHLDGQLQRLHHIQYEKKVASWRHGDRHA